MGKKKKTLKLFEIVNNLKPTDALFKKKLNILTLLMESPDGGHIISDDLIKWAKKVGITTELNCEDKTSWWTCNY